MPGPEASPPLPSLPDITADQAQAAIDRNEHRLREAFEQEYEAALTFQAAAARTGLLQDELQALVAAGDLPCMDGPHGDRLPAWQFHRDVPDGHLPGIAQLSAVFPGHILSLSSWMRASRGELAGRTPVQAIVDGDLPLVVAVASHLGD